MKTDEYTLREIKQARSRIAVTEAFMERLERTPFENISVRAVCESVEISEATFFNYFGEKIDIINYRISLLFLKAYWKAREESPPGKNLGAIESVFMTLVTEAGSYNVICQIISVILARRRRVSPDSVPPVERHLLFPDCPGIESIPLVPLEDYVERRLESASESGELPSSVNTEEAAVSLIALFAGTLLAGASMKPRERARCLTRHLDFFRKGMGLEPVS